jgi:hypothetical protein
LAHDHHSASSAVFPDEKFVVVANLYDGLDWYNISDRTCSRSVPLRINHNVPIPVLLVDGGKVLVVGGTSGSAKVLDSHTVETIQTLEHNRKKLFMIKAHSIVLIKILIFQPTISSKHWYALTPPSICNNFIMAYRHFTSRKKLGRGTSQVERLSRSFRYGHRN